MKWSLIIFMFTLTQFLFADVINKDGNENDIKEYDVVIIGGGVSGTALFYTLSHYTNVSKVALIEKEKAIGTINSNHTQNSQTLHFGDIETNYTLEKAKKVKFLAQMVKAYVERYSSSLPNERLFNKTHKMVLSVGEEEVRDLEKRYEEFKDLYPKLRKISKDEIAQLEPKIVEGRDPSVPLLGLITEDGYAIDYGLLANSMAEKAIENSERCQIYLGENVLKIEKEKTDEKNTTDNHEGGYLIQSNHHQFRAKTVVVSAGGYSLLFAHKLGYGQNYSILSVAGSFFFSNKTLLKGKIYTMQIPDLPFAAVHGDPEVQDPTITRFGPTAKGIAMLERWHTESIIPYFKTLGFGMSTIMAFTKILFEPKTFKFISTNALYDLPIIGKRLFVAQIKKLIPTIKASDIHRAKNWGGTRPQVVNLKTQKLELGEAQLEGDHILFNITPSPGASTCLGNAYRDVQKVMKDLMEGEGSQTNYQFDKGRFEADFIID